MNLQSRLLLFYLALSASDKNSFRSMLGPKLFDKIIAPENLADINREIAAEYGSKGLPDVKPVDYDIAIMQLVRHLVENSASNVELAISIEAIIGKSVSRPEKRSKYELQGKLLEALMKAPRDKLIRLRNELAHAHITGRNSAKDSSLDKWFSIILGASK